jgi:N-methylhydantoinase B
VRLHFPGGGGYGDPKKRERAAVARDIEAGYVTPEAAAHDYGYRE